MSRAALSPLIKTQVEKLTGATGGQRFLLSSSSIIIPKKARCSNTSSQSSSSYTSMADQMSSLAETFLQNSRDSDHVYTSLPMLPSTCEKLEHTAARDRIQVKNKRQQQARKGKLNALKEQSDDNNDQIDVFITAPDAEQEESEDEIVQSAVTTTMAPQITVDLSGLDTARSRLRPRDHSADHILSTAPTLSTNTLNVQRSTSFKRPQEVNEAKYLHRTIRKIEKNDDQKQATEDHIYDNMDIFKQKRINDKHDSTATAEHSSTITIREQAKPATRLRPVSMIITTTEEKETTSELENAFKQLKKRAYVEPKKAEVVKPVVVESVQTIVLPPVKIEESPSHVAKENEPIVSTAKLTVKSLVVPPPPNRRRTVGGIQLPGNNKVTTEETTPTPSWIDIAKQKQGKFESIVNETEEQKPFTKQTNISSNPTSVQENISAEPQANRKPVYEPVITRRTPPAVTTQIVERDSIRALKANNPNRINNLIQLFNK